jgi:rare lipoprotein A
MRTGNRTKGTSARRFTWRSMPGLAVAGLSGLAPLAASLAAAPDASIASVEPVSSAALIELVPLQPTTDVSAPGEPATSPDTSAPSVPPETSLGRGTASYYAARFDGRRTASGERFDNDEMTAAHRTLPFGSRVRVTNPANGRSVVVRINDRGPFSHGRMIDVSRAAADRLGLVARGHGMVELALIAD